MKITVTCQACKKQFSARQEHAGKQAKCPACGATIVIAFDRHTVNEQPANPQWTYIRDTLFGTTEQVGPITEAEILSLAKQGKLKRDTLLSNPSCANGAFFQLQQVPAFLAALEQFERERESQRQEKQQALMVVAQEEEQRQAQERHRIAAFSDCQNMDAMLRIEDKVKPILTRNEAIEYMAIQQTFFILNPVPDAVVATNRRLIFYKPKWFGAYEFQDFLWLDLHNAHFRQGYFGATFWADHRGGQLVMMDWLPRVAVQKLYRMAQEREEQARWARHELHLQTLKAGATQVNVQTNNSFVQPPPTSPVIDAQIIERHDR